jgi:release factor glutamine methyltransferase
MAADDTTLLDVCRNGREDWRKHREEKKHLVLLFRAPAVYPPQGDTWLLADAVRAELVAEDKRVLDLCAGSGALSVAAARHGATDLTAVDISRRAVLSTWVNTRLRGLHVRVLRGDLLTPVAGERFDLILANPPYVVAAADRLPTGGAARCWDAGTDGRAVLDRICAEAPPFLAPGGVLLLVFSALCGVGKTLDQLGDAGLDASVVTRTIEPFGPVMTSRAALLEERGVIEPGQRHEELVVVRAQAPS